jgi:hypothetical protein
MILVDAQTLADLLGTSRDYVYAHAAELGVLRLGTGPKARLRFDPEKAIATLSQGRRDPQPATSEANPTRRRRRRKSAAASIPLLAVRENRVA